MAYASNAEVKGYWVRPSSSQGEFLTKSGLANGLSGRYRSIQCFVTDNKTKPKTLSPRKTGRMAGLLRICIPPLHVIQSEKLTALPRALDA